MTQPAPLKPINLSPLFAGIVGKSKHLNRFTKKYHSRSNHQARHNEPTMTYGEARPPIKSKKNKPKCRQCGEPRSKYVYLCGGCAG